MTGRLTIVGDHALAARVTALGLALDVASPEAAPADAIVLADSVPDEALRMIVHAALARDAAEQARARAEAVHAALLEGSPDGIVAIDPDQRIVVFNAAAQRMFGYAPEDVIGEPLAILIPEEVRGRHDEHVESYRRRGPSVRTMGDRSRLWGRRRDGERFPMEASISREQHGTEGLLIAVVRDVSRQARVEQQLQQVLQVEGVGRVASAVIHDVNNLLAVVRVAAELAAAEKHAPAAAEHLAAIGLAVDRGAKLTRRLLTYARSRSGDAAVVELDAVIEELAPLLRNALGEAIHLECTTSSNARVNVDRTRFEQAILNCVVNARDALPGGGCVRVRTERVSETSASIVITDNGVGIPRAALPRIFEPFFTTKADASGTGLGLWMSLEMVRGAGGTMCVESEELLGTTVSITLPVSEASPIAPARVSSLPPARAVSVLLVEDDDVLRRLLARSLELYGFQVHSASGAGEALGHLEKWDGELDVLVTDAIMPFMNGRELADRVRRCFPDVCVVHVTGHAAASEAVELRPNEALLYKPFAAEALRSAIARVLGAQ